MGIFIAFSCQFQKEAIFVGNLLLRNIMNITIKIVDVRTYQVHITEGDDHKTQEKPTLTHIGNSLEITGKHEGNIFTIRMRTISIASFAVDEGEQFATITLHLHNMQVIIKYAYYKMGNLSKIINHKFKEDFALLERILAE